MFSGAIFSFMVLPETKKMTLHQFEQFMNKSVDPPYGFDSFEDIEPKKPSILSRILTRARSIEAPSGRIRLPRYFRSNEAIVRKISIPGPKLIEIKESTDIEIDKRNSNIIEIEQHVEGYTPAIFKAG